MFSVIVKYESFTKHLLSQWRAINFLSSWVVAAVQPLASRARRDPRTTRVGLFCLVNLAIELLHIRAQRPVSSSRKVRIEIFGKDSIFRAAPTFIVLASIRLPNTKRPFARTSRHSIIGVPSGKRRPQADVATNPLIRISS